MVACSEHHGAVNSHDRRALQDDKVVADAEKAASEAQVKADKALKDVGQMWEDVEEKPAAISLTLAILVGLYALNGVVTSVDHIPVVSGVFELVGVFVSAWFVYRYLIFGPDRQELKEELNTFFSKVKGDK